MQKKQNRVQGWRPMTQTDLDDKLEEVERLLNDPDVELEPWRVWMLLDEVADGHLVGK